MEEITDETIHVHQLQATTKKITINREMDESSFVFADKDMVTLVLRNLLSNAIKFTPENGDDYYTAERESQLCRVSVIDNGIGMDQETLVRIQENNYYSYQRNCKGKRHRTWTYVDAGIFFPKTAAHY